MADENTNKTSTTTKVAASVTAAALLAGGGALTYNLMSENDGIDWSLYDLDVPTLNVPKLDVPNLNIVKLDVPTLNTTSYYTETVTPEPLTETLTEIVNSPKLDIGKLENPAENLPEYMAFFETLENMFRDKRNLDHDVSLNTNMLNNTVMNQWIKVYKNYAKINPVKYIPIEKKFRMISEVSPLYTEVQIATLNKNLELFKSKGYDSVLVTFTKNDTAEAVLNTVKYVISYHKMNVWLAYTGPERLSDSVFMPVENYTIVLAKCAPYLTGFVNGWRRTSVHFFKQDDAFMNYTNTILRNANPNILLLGELYYGETYTSVSKGKLYGWDTNTFENASADVLSNFGYVRINFKYLFNTILPKLDIKNKAFVGLVLGSRPYYKQTVKQIDEEMAIKTEIENRFFDYGCVGTITLSNNGKDDGTNNLTLTSY
jgi:hypothetical protein